MQQKTPGKMTEERIATGDGKMHRRNFLQGSFGVLAATSGAGVFTAAAARASVQPVLPQQARVAAGRATLFPGFRPMKINTSGATIHAVVGGSGPPPLLLHGHPQTHVMWHKVAPRLARRFTVVAADLRGCGDSSKPSDGQNHFGYSKRAMAQDFAEVMTHLGFEKFAVGGADRGARVTTRMTLDYPERVTRAAMLDNLPSHILMPRNFTKEYATAVHHWFFLSQPSPYPEKMIENSLELYLARSFSRAPAGSITKEAFAEYRRCYSSPAAIHAACEDYRAGTGIDLEHDAADWDKKIACPVLALWAEKGTVARFFSPVLDHWKEKALDVRGRAMPGGHYLAEELPDEVFEEFNLFFSA
jgi:haloacetate dehalogenase